MATKMKNSPKVKIALIGVSRDCFPVELARSRLKRLAKACRQKGLRPYTCKTIVENENAAMAALAETLDAGANAAVIFLGNFGPEGPLSILAEEFPGPVMACAAAEESKDSLTDGRGDAFCGMLNASYNFRLRNAGVHIPQMPVALAEQLAEKIAHFETVARILMGVWGLKIFTFGPRPQDFYACNAPLKQLYDLGVEVMENSELDLLHAYQAVDAKDPAVRRTAGQMAGELGRGNTYPDLPAKLARLEVALRRFAGDNLGARDYAVFANKCWPAFERAFGFVPCYVNSRLAAGGMPVACEVDIYGALSEYLGQLATDAPATLLDINNTVPPDMIPAKADLKGASPEDLFMGFHCGNTPASCMKNCAMTYHLIMKRLLEPDGPPDITRGTLEGQIAPGPVTFLRLQGDIDGGLDAYLAQGGILDIDPASFGCVSVVAIPNFARFYRHVLIAKGFPHHAAVAFGHCGKALFDALDMMGVDGIDTPLPGSVPYDGENPWAK